MAKKKESVLHKKLAEELTSMLPALDEEGLAFLVEQGKTHLYNMEIEREEAERAAAEEREGAGESGKAKTGKKTGKNQSGSTGRGAKANGPANFRIERSSSGASYHIISGGNWKMFTDDEMLKLVHIAQSNDPVADVTERLWRWLDTERPDTFADLEIDGLKDPRMRELVELLRAKFAVRSR
jgi:hypothetical protein